MARYDITLHGCDDSTRVTFHLTDEQYGLMCLIASATEQASQSECEPRLSVTKHTEVITSE